MRQVKAYTRTATTTANPPRLLLLLFHGVMKYIREGVTHYENGRLPEGSESLARANDIVIMLQNSLDDSRAPDLCNNLVLVYEYAVAQLSLAIIRGDAEPAKNAQLALGPVADAFIKVVEQAPAP